MYIIILRAFFHTSAIQIIIVFYTIGNAFCFLKNSVFWAFLKALITKGNIWGRTVFMASLLIWKSEQKRRTGINAGILM
jgi:hypothetical protein